MNIRLSCLSVCMLLGAATIGAQIPTMNVGGKKGSAEVYLQSLDVRVDITGNMASTVFTMTFKNRTGKILEGELIFPLPDGVTVSRYALDINGKMREAVPVEKAKATQVFEEIEQRRVDPGLLERVEGNNFRTRIYPVPANGVRTITIGYEQELPVDNRLLRYRLPMDYKDVIENFSVKAVVHQSKEKPRLEEKPADELRFDEQGFDYTASFSGKNHQLSRSLAFSLPVADDMPQVWVQPASGSHYFTALCFPEAKTRKKQWSDNLGIVWDASLSGLHRDIESETELLNAIIRDKKNLTVTLYLLNNRLVEAKTFAITDGNFDALKAVLKAVEYDGGTNYSAINLTKSSCREFLFFSDGLSTLSDADFTSRRNPKRPVHCIVSSPRADYGALKWIAGRTGGKFINLNASSPAEAQKDLMNETLQFLGVRKSSADLREIYPSVSVPVTGAFSVAGIMDGSRAEITLLFGYGDKVEIEKTVKLDVRNATGGGNIYRMWAQKKINELDMRHNENKEELTELGKQFGIVTRNTSLIVLETIQDYLTYDITPPSELLDEYNRLKKNRDDRATVVQQDLLAAAGAAADELKAWWMRDFKPVKAKYPQPDRRSNSPAASMESIDHNAFRDVVNDEMVVNEEANKLEESVVVSGFATQAQFSRSVAADERVEKEEVSDKKQTAIARPVIKIMPLKQDKDYMKTLTGKVGADYKKYLELRRDYIGTPGFYFDMADWFFKHDDKQHALLILTSIADMDLENASLFRLLGYRLKEYGEYALESYICKKVIEWRPGEPQSYRDYALALADEGLAQEALNTMYSVLTQSYARNIGQRSAGIEEVTVTELNRMMANNNKLNGSFIDKKLIQPMPVDVRVVINWNMNSTDIDLHVTDPNGETCFYGHRETIAGGRISRDITQGYGPEQFMLKKAIKGKYKIYVNYFGDSQVKAEGPSTIMVEIYTGYSDDMKEQRQVTCLQMSKEAVSSGNGLVQVAEFEF